MNDHAIVSEDSLQQIISTVLLKVRHLQQWQLALTKNGEKPKNVKEIALKSIKQCEIWRATRTYYTNRKAESRQGNRLAEQGSSRSIHLQNAQQQTLGKAKWWCRRDQSGFQRGLLTLSEYLNAKKCSHCVRPLFFFRPLIRLLIVTVLECVSQFFITEVSICLHSAF